MRAAAGLFVALACATLAAGCGSGKASSSANTSTDKGVLLWEQPLRSHPVHKIMQGGFLSECKKLGYTCQIVGTEAVDVPGSNALAQAALAKGNVKGFADYAFDPSTYPFIGQVSQQYKLPVVSWHIPIAQGAAPGLTAIANTDPAAYAKKAADAIGDKLGGAGTVTVTEGSFNTTENLVAKTFTDEMAAKYPNVKVLAPQEEGFDAPKAIAKAVAILQAHPEANAAFSTTGGGPVTWAGAQKQAGRKLTIIGMDYVRQNLDLVKSGEVFAVVAQPLWDEGAKMADLLDAAIKKQTVSYENPLPADIVTADKAQQYYSYLDQADAAAAAG
jgi:ribose transport system substrate-binding protein